jgi:hypothetical protein
MERSIGDFALTRKLQHESLDENNSLCIGDRIGFNHLEGIIKRKF